MAPKANPTVTIMESKFIVQELNNLFQENYNMLSMDSMSRIEMLQLIVNVLNKLEVFENVMNFTVNNETLDQSVLEILHSLNSIKYIPEYSEDPIEFRNGLAMTNRMVTHSLLFWLLSNKNQVKRRAYIARYVERIVIPPQLLLDEQVALLNSSYEALIQEFWKTYESNKHENKNATAAKALQLDIIKMDTDMQNLTQLIQKQKDKVSNISNKETFTVSVKSFLSESNQSKKIDNQIKSLQVTTNNLEGEIKATKDLVNQKKIHRPTNMNLIVQISEQLHINKILTETQLPEEKHHAENELQVHETVALESDPMINEMDELIKSMERLTIDVKINVEKRIASTNTDSDKLGPFRNQATMIANKKQEVSTKVMEYKVNLENLYTSIEEKKQLLYSLVGGEVLHGNELKQFISKLRERSVLYKQYRSRLKSLTEEQSLLGRTYDILSLNEPSISNAVQLTKENSELKEEVHDLQEAKIKLRTLLQKLDINRSEATQSREELNSMREIVHKLNEAYNDAVKNFEESTGFLSSNIEEKEEAKENLQTLIKTKEEKWKQVCMNIDKYEQILLKLGEDLINSSESDNSETLPKMYANVFETEQIRNQKLKMEVTNTDETKIINELQLEIIRKLIVLLSSIWDEKK